MREYENKLIKLNAPLGGHPAGITLPIKVDKDGIPKERYWRDRLKDSKIDKCVEFVTPVKKKLDTKPFKAENKDTGGKD